LGEYLEPGALDRLKPEELKALREAVASQGPSVWDAVLQRHGFVDLVGPGALDPARDDRPTAYHPSWLERITQKLGNAFGTPRYNWPRPGEALADEGLGIGSRSGGPQSRGRGFSTNDRNRAMENYLGKDLGNVHGRALASGPVLGALGGAVAGSRSGPLGIALGAIGGAIANSGGGWTVPGNSGWPTPDDPPVTRRKRQSRK
jgi:hypothetical protein